MKNLKGFIKKYIRDCSGVNALIFALVLPAMVAAGGLAVDLANAYNVKNRLGNALDKTALATANSSGTEAELTEIAEKFFEVNFRESGLGQAYDLDVEFSEKIIRVSAAADVELLFMGMFGKDDMNVTSMSEVTREMSGIEAVMVLDVTGSMAGSNIAALKSASTEFLNIMFDRISDPDFLRLGIVPYSNTVNVSSYGWGEYPDGSYYGPAFVERPETDDHKTASEIEYDLDNTADWHGCVLAEEYPGDVRDDTPSGFGMYRYPRVCQSYWYGYCWSYNNDPNRACTKSPVVPLGNDRAILQDTIDNLDPVGNTLGNFGLLWGWRLISPEEPFTEGAAYDDREWKKAVIMMTDGVNTMNNTYSAYGRTSEHDVRPDDLDDRVGEICTGMKDKGITVYTITFGNVNESTKDIYRQCASTESVYKHVDSDAELEELFKSIANQLSRLHLSK